MHSELKNNHSFVKTMIILGAVSIFTALLSVIVSDIFLPISAAFFACFMLFDRSTKKWISIAVIAALLVACLILDLSFLLFVVTLGACALVLFFGYKKGLNKAELSLYLSILFIICTIGVLYLSGANQISDYQPASVLNYYKSTMDTLREEFISELVATLQQQGELTMEISDASEMVEMLFVSVTNLFLALAAIIGFLYAGIQIKVFTHLTRRLESSPRPRLSWHFGVSNLFAYFYVCVFLLSTFFGAMDSVLSIALMNLYYIFLIVFAYIGFNYTFAMASRSRNRRITQFFLIFAIVIMNILAAQLLSLIGVFITTMHNKFIQMNNQNPNGTNE